MTPEARAEKIVREWIAGIPMSHRPARSLLPALREFIAAAIRALAVPPPPTPPDAGMQFTWLVERSLDGIPHWLSWRGKSERSWVTDADAADKFDYWDATKTARWLSEEAGITCKAVEHGFAVPVGPGQATAGETSEADVLRRDLSLAQRQSDVLRRRLRAIEKAALALLDRRDLWADGMPAEGFNLRTALDFSRRPPDATALAGSAEGEAQCGDRIESPSADRVCQLPRGHERHRDGEHVWQRAVSISHPAEAEQRVAEVARLAALEKGIRDALADGGLFVADLVEGVKHVVRDRALYSRRADALERSIQARTVEAFRSEPIPTTAPSALSTAERAVVEAALIVQEYMGRWANTSSTWKEFYEACERVRALRAQPAPDAERQ